MQMKKKLLYDYWMKGLVIVKLYHWWYNNMQQRQFGAEFSLYLLFDNFHLFSEIFIRIDEYTN